MHPGWHSGDGTIDEHDAVRNGGSALRTVFSEDLTGWLRRRGSLALNQEITSQPGHRSTSWTEACRTDARVALLEASYEAVVLHVGPQMAVPVAIQGAAEQRPRQTGRQDARTNPFDGAWAQLDSVDCHDLFLTKIPMSKSCPRFLRRRFRECQSLALRERFRGKMVGRCTGRNTWLEVVRADPHDVASQAAWVEGGWQGGVSLTERKSSVVAGGQI